MRRLSRRADRIWYKAAVRNVGMLACCCWDAVSGISSVVQASANVLLLLIAWKGGKQAYRKWKNEKAVQRSEFLESLMNKFEKDNVQGLISLADDPNVTQQWLDEVLKDNHKAIAAQSSFRFFSYLCYLKAKEFITYDEFALFEDTLTKILLNEQVQEYLRITMNRLSNDGVAYPFKDLLDYAASNHIDIFYTTGTVDKNEGTVQVPIEVSTGMSIVEENRKKSPLTVEELSQYPVAVIRINRLFRPDMKPEELYDATRGWWRVNLNMANKAKYVLSVAEGCVKEVYAITAWHKYGTAENGVIDGADGRYQFEGVVVKDEAIRQLYVGRSIDGLFKQGDAYPVRYFGVKD